MTFQLEIECFVNVNSVNFIEKGQTNQVWREDGELNSWKWWMTVEFEKSVSNAFVLFWYAILIAWKMLWQQQQRKIKVCTFAFHFSCFIQVFVVATVEILQSAVWYNYAAVHIAFDRFYPPCMIRDAIVCTMYTYIQRRTNTKHKHVCATVFSIELNGWH